MHLLPCHEQSKREMSLHLFNFYSWISSINYQIQNLGFVVWVDISYEFIFLEWRRGAYSYFQFLFRGQNLQNDADYNKTIEV